MKKIVLQANFEKFTSRHDRTYKLEFGTPELSGKDTGAFGDLLKCEGVLYFSEIEMSDNDLSEIDKITEEQAEQFGGKAKTKSQRLRNTLYIYWEQLGSKDDFQAFYEKKMESLISLIQEKLN